MGDLRCFFQGMLVKGHVLVYCVFKAVSRYGSHHGLHVLVLSVKDDRVKPIDVSTALEHAPWIFPTAAIANKRRHAQSRGGFELVEDQGIVCSERHPQRRCVGVLQRWFSNILFEAPGCRTEQDSKTQPMSRACALLQGGICIEDFYFRGRQRHIACLKTSLQTHQHVPKHHIYDISHIQD